MEQPEENSGHVTKGWKCMGKVWTNAEVFTSICLFICIFGWGLFLGLFGPSMLELEERTGATTGQVTHMMTAMTGGGILVVLLVGWALDHMDERIILSVIFAGFGIFTVALPWSTTYGALLGLSIVVGAFMGGLDVGMNVTTLLTWSWDASALMQAFHFTFAVATVISPWITKPFLSSNIGNDPFSSGTKHNKSVSQENCSDVTILGNYEANCTDSPEQENEEGTKIMFAWLIVGIYFELVACAFMACYFYYQKTDGTLKKKEKRTDQSQRSLVSVEQVGRPYTACMWILMFFTFASMVSLEAVFSSVLVVFSVKGLDFTKVQGLVLATVFRGCFAASRGVSIPFAFVINPTWMMFIDTVLIGSSFLALAIAVELHPAVIWVCTGVAGAGMASYYGAVMSWASRYIPVSGKGGAVFLCGTWTGCLAVPMLTGYLFDKSGPMSFIYVCFGDACALVIVFVITQIVAYKWGPHYSKKVSVNISDNGEELGQPLKALS